MTFQAGDVLLYRGHGPISWAIRFIDRSDVNHAAIALDGTTLAEATGHGLASGPIDKSIQRNERTIVRRLAVAPADPGPAVAKAQGYLDDGVPYGYQQILLLALLCATRQVPLPGLAGKLLRRALDGAAAVLNRMVDNAEGTRFMICSEYVYRAYLEGGSVLAIEVRDGAAVAGAGSEDANLPLLDWAAGQSDEALDEAVAMAASGSPMGAVPGDLDDLAAAVEEELNGIIVDYAIAVAPDDPEVLAMAAASPAASVAAAGEAFPTPAELLASLVRFSDGLAVARADDGGATPAGAGLVGAVAGGALHGLLSTKTDPNFVTPGDLLVSPSLTTVDDLQP